MQCDAVEQFCGVQFSSDEGRPRRDGSRRNDDFQRRNVLQAFE